MYINKRKKIYFYLGVKIFLGKRSICFFLWIRPRVRGEKNSFLSFKQKNIFLLTFFQVFHV